MADRWDIVQRTILNELAGKESRRAERRLGMEEEEFPARLALLEEQIQGAQASRQAQQEARAQRAIEFRRKQAVLPPAEKERAAAEIGFELEAAEKEATLGLLPKRTEFERKKAEAAVEDFPFLRQLEAMEREAKLESDKAEAFEKRARGEYYRAETGVAQGARAAKAAARTLTIDNALGMLDPEKRALFGAPIVRLARIVPGQESLTEGDQARLFNLAGFIDAVTDKFKLGLSPTAGVDPASFAEAAEAFRYGAGAVAEEGERKLEKIADLFAATSNIEAQLGAQAAGADLLDVIAAGQGLAAKNKLEPGVVRDLFTDPEVLDILLQYAKRGLPKAVDARTIQQPKARRLPP